jgi:DNA-binding Xre family transcriptional regulator
MAEMTTGFRLSEELRIYNRLAHDDMSQSELARQSGVHFVTVNRISRNLTTRVDLETLDRLSGVLGCDPGDLIEREKGRRR